MPHWVMEVEGVEGGNSAQGTMCCVPVKLVPRVKRTPGLSDGDTLIRDLQVFYHSVRSSQIYSETEASRLKNILPNVCFMSNPLMEKLR